MNNIIFQDIFRGSLRVNIGSGGSNGRLRLLEGKPTASNYVQNAVVRQVQACTHVQGSISSALQLFWGALISLDFHWG